MKSHDARTLRNCIGAVLKQCWEEPVEIRRFGRRAAMVISPDAFAEYEELKKIVNSHCIEQTLRDIAELSLSGRASRGLGAFRALAPYWREAGVKGAPRARSARAARSRSET